MKTVEKVYKSYWRAVKELIESMPLKSIDKDKLNTIKHSISILPLGKFYVDEQRFKWLRKNVED